jgi:hypothetical protein
MEKALLHMVHLELLERGSYRACLENGLAEFRSSRLNVIPDHLCVARAWFTLREIVVSRVKRHLSRRPVRKAVVGSLRHAAIATLRCGPGWRAAFGISSTELAIVESVVALLVAARRRGQLDACAFEEAWLALPRRLRPPTPRAWRDIRDVAVREWANAHRLVFV